MAVDASNGYIVNFSVYLGSEGKNRRSHGLGYDIVMKMARPFLNVNHHVFFDNYFSSPILLDHLLDQQTYARSTVWCTRKDLPPCTKNKLRQLEETVIWQRESLLFTKWHNKRDIALILVYPHVTKWAASDSTTYTKQAKCSNWKAICLWCVHQKYGWL